MCCSPWGGKESDTAERIHFHFSFSCIGEGNGNPLQCSCLENIRDGGAWWAVVYGVAQSWTRLERLSSSSSSSPKYFIIFVAMVNGIVSLISVSDFSLLVYRNARDFCVLTLYGRWILNHWTTREVLACLSLGVKLSEL